jgi:hypothetical protein
MVEPTRRLLELFDTFGAKLTIMADVAEILKFKEYHADYGRDDFHSQEIEGQLRDAIRRGHDVQLHIHSSYFGAKFNGGQWIQDWKEYDFARLPIARMDWMIRQGKSYLESLLQSIDPGYRCEVFRAANWSVSPSKAVIAALGKNGFRIDTSVFKYGRRKGLVNFDYTSAFSEQTPWPASADDICRRDEAGQLWEFPIYSERRNIAAFATPNRIHRVIQGRVHRLTKEAKSNVAGPAHEGVADVSWFKKVFESSAWKADFNQCTGRQLIRALNRAEKAVEGSGSTSPFVLIGHSKLFNRYNALCLRPFLAYVAKNPARFEFGKFTDFPLDTSATRMSGESGH